MKKSYVGKFQTEQVEFILLNAINKSELLLAKSDSTTIAVFIYLYF